MKVESLAKHVDDTADTITKGKKETCSVEFTEHGVSKHETVDRLVYVYAENDCIESRYVQWRGWWVEVDGDNIAWL